MKLKDGSTIAGPFLFLCALIVVTPLEVTHSSAKNSVRIQVADSTTHRLTVKIETLTAISRGSVDTLEISLDAADVPIAGFSLKIASNQSDLEIVNILPGDLLDSCGWELFSALPSVTAPSAPEVIWRITGLAKSSADTSQADCLGLNRRVSIAKIVVTKTSWTGCEQAAFFFYWEDCRDNVLSDASGQQLYVSERVVDYVPVDWSSPRTSFPNRTGPLPSCTSQRALNPPVRLVEFHNGGVE